MVRRRTLGAIRTITPFLVLALVFLGGTYFVLLTSMEQYVQEDAGLAASKISRYLENHPSELDRLGRGAGLSDAARDFIRSEAEAEHLVDLRLTETSGRLIFEASGPSLGLGEHGGTVSLNALVASSALVKSGASSSRELSIISDQATRWRELDRLLVLAVVSLAFLTACSFGVPAFVFLREVARRERGEERMEFLVRHDSMTALLNRTAFNKTLERHLQETGQELCALHFVDVDRFKSINDSLGHNVGDEVIRQVAARLAALMAPGDLAARFGGDEFVLAQMRIGGDSDVETRATAIRHAIQEPLQTGEHQLRVTVSVGSSIFPRDGNCAAELEKAADLALYCAKSDGRDTCRMYNPTMDAALEARRKIEKALLHAYSNESFDLHFQPIVVADGQKLLGFEVLLRLNTEDGQEVTPTDFIPVAEEMGLISQIGAWVIRKACFSAATWPEHLTVAVNMSPRQFENGELCAIVETALRDSGLAASRLELEITEGLLVSDTERVMSQLRHLKALGVSIAMDDFGTGYSSLSYLWQFPFDKLKIDRSFMRVLADGDQQVSSILNTIISLGRTLNLQVTAEGVETQAQADLLKELNCNQLQGYYFGHPTPESDIAATILTSARGEIEDRLRPYRAPAALAG